MLRIVSLVAALLVLAAPSASADENYVDRTNGFRVTVPSGWEKLVGEKPEGLDLGLISPRFDTSQALCGIGTEPTEETRSASQAEINEAFASEINAAFWASIVAGDQVSDIVVDVARSEVKNGRRVFYATANYTEKTDEGEVRSQSNFVLHLIPGQMLLGQCQVQLAHAAAEQADFKTILESTEPLGNVVAGRQPPPTRQTAALVLYAGPLFDGQRRALTHDVPSLPQAGWRGLTGSFALKGTGLWQICDGVDYTGNCRVIAGAAAAKLGDRALRIASARRVAVSRDPRVVLGLIADTAAATKQRAQKPRRR